MRNIIHYLGCHLRGATYLQFRFYGMQKNEQISAIELKAWRVFFSILPSCIRNILDRLLAWIDEKTQAPPFYDDLINRISPDLVVVTPIVDFGSKEIELLKVSRKIRVPSVLAVASWDNLTNKGRIQIKPEYVAVWNQAMAEEAIGFHGVPKSRIWITGAPTFDRWFKMQPSCTREDFMRSLGLLHGRKTVLYLCSSNGIAGYREFEFVFNWINALKANSHSRGELLKDINILVRPHPMAVAQWKKRVLCDAYPGAVFAGARVWPIDGKHPTSGHGAESFFDSLYYADAVVGLNTSAMMEAAILRKPVLTIERHLACATQQFNLHYHHLAESGFLRIASNMEDHVLQLIDAIEHPSRLAEEADRFIESFVRPFGRDQSASQLLAGLFHKMINDSQVTDNRKECFR